MNKYRVAQVGIGHRGVIHANAFLQISDRFELVGLCDINQERLNGYANDKKLPSEILFTDAEKMMEATKPDVFCFVTQPDLRLPMAKLAGKYNVKGLAFEKPMATSLKEAWAITKMCKDKGIKAIISHQHKYLTSMQKMKEIVDSGDIGEVSYVNATCQAWLAQLGTHYMDYILWANNGSPARWAVGHVHGKELLSDHHLSPNYTMGHVEFENGVRSYFEFGKLSASHMPKENFWVDDRLTVYGTYGYAWGDANGRWGAFTKSSGGDVIGEVGDDWGTQQSTRLQPLYMKDFADWLDDDSKVHPCNIDISYHGYEILEAVCISAVDNIRVDLPLDPDTCEDIFERMRKELPECPERVN
ncbi:gfo/Idh/MocA family oxidoreductase [Candidatus Poribacteria bacterium]|nr:gfo/Idh/MocA family oxidoreductase [Candidatus Poribacteria bacterium]